MLRDRNVALHHPMSLRACCLALAASASLLPDAKARAAEDPGACLPGGGGRLVMEITGAFEAGIDWGNAGTHCEGGPRPRGDALRLMFSREDDGLLVVIGITGLGRDVASGELPANLTIVRQGLGEFYGSLGADACRVTVDVNETVPALADAWRVSGRGWCERPIEAIARDGEVVVGPFEFTGMAIWPDEDDLPEEDD
jgi:hypothetical protein